MNFLLVINESPFVGTSGAGIFGESFIEACIKNKDKLVVAILGEGDCKQKELIKNKKEYYKSNNILFCNIECPTNFPKRSKLMKVVNPSLLDLFPQGLYSQKINIELLKIIFKEKIDICFAYTFASALACESIKIPKVFLVMEDIIAVGQSKKKNFTKNLYTFYYIKYLRRLFLQKKIIKFINREFLFSAHLSFDYFQRLNNLKMERGYYFNHPVLIEKVKETKQYDKNSNFLFIGLLGKMSSVNYQILYDWLQPTLEYLLKKNLQNKVKFIGSSNNIKHFEPIFKNYKGYDFKNKISCLKKFYNQIDVLFTPSSSALGVRTRILEALGHGVPSIISNYDQAACPTLINGENTIVLNNPSECGPKLHYILKNKNTLKNLSINGRKTVCIDHNPTKFMKQLKTTLEIL